MTNLDKTITEIQKEIDSKRQGDYLNIGNSHNQIVNANVFSKEGYKGFYYSQKDSWVEGGDMVKPSSVKDNDIVISYYNNNGLENSFIVENVNYIESEQIALDQLALKIKAEEN